MSEMTRRYRNLVFDSARWDGFEFRDDDIVISPPPKCGTTWTQTICALLVLGPPPFPASLDLISPWLDMLTRERSAVLADLEAQTHRRFIKAHTPMDGIPWDDRVTYICVARDPRDVAMSWDNHMDNMDVSALIGAREAAVGLDDVLDVLAAGPPPRLESARDRFWYWVDERPVVGVSCLAGTVEHVQSFWAVRDRPNVVLLRYEDLQADLAGQMRALADRLGIEVPEEQWPALVEAATFESMRGRASELAPNATAKLWHDDRQFFHRGTSGQWRELLDDADLGRYRERAVALADPDLIDWLHPGGLGV